MKKIVGDWNTTIILEGDEPEKICKLGQGEDCCAFLVGSGRGFECIRMDYPNNTSIFDRLDKGTMNAKGRGEWKGCPWNDSENNQAVHDEIEGRKRMDEQDMKQAVKENIGG